MFSKDEREREEWRARINSWDRSSKEDGDTERAEAKMILNNSTQSSESSRKDIEH